MTRRFVRSLCVAVTAVVGLAACAPATAPPRVAPSAPPATAAASPGVTPAAPGAGAPAPFEPTVGQAGKDVVWVPTSAELVERMLDLAKVTSSDYVIDLGSGDGRNIIAAARRGAQGHGVEFNPDMVALSNRLAREAGVAGRARFIEGDMYKADLSKATVLALFLLPTNLEQLKDRFLAMPAGTRIVLNTFTLDDWEPDTTSDVGPPCTSWCKALLLVVPARVSGQWRIDGGGELTLTQEYRALNGTLATGGGAPVAVTGKVSAASVAIEAGASTYAGRVEGDRITGTVTTGGASRPWAATRVVFKAASRRGPLPQSGDSR